MSKNSLRIKGFFHSEHFAFHFQHNGHRNNFGFRLCGMTGNVREWKADVYEEYYLVWSPTENPSGPAASRFRVFRGGSWADVLESLTWVQRSFSRP